LGLAKVTTVKKFGKNTSLCTSSGVAAYYVKSIVLYMLCAVQDETALHTAYTSRASPEFRTFITPTPDAPHIYFQQRIVKIPFGEGYCMSAF